MIATPSAARLPGKCSSGKAPQRCRLGPEDYYSRRPNSKAAGSLLGRGGDKNQRSGRVSGFCVTPPSGELERFAAVEHVFWVCPHTCARCSCSLLRESPRPGSLTKASVARLSLWVETNDPDSTTKTSWIPKHIYFSVGQHTRFIHQFVHYFNPHLFCMPATDLVQFLSTKDVVENKTLWLFRERNIQKISLKKIRCFHIGIKTLYLNRGTWSQT